MVAIAYQHLRSPLHHLPDCEQQCGKDCPVQEFHAALAEPVLPDEIAAAKAEQDRFEALARGDFSHLEGAGA